MLLKIRKTHSKFLPLKSCMSNCFTLTVNIFNMSEKDMIETWIKNANLRSWLFKGLILQHLGQVTSDTGCDTYSSRR